MGIGLDAWWDEPAYKPCNTLHLRGLFIFRKLCEHDPAIRDKYLASSADISTVPSAPMLRWKSPSAC